MEFGIGPIVTNIGIMVFLGKFYEGQNKEISKWVPSDYMALRWLVLESDKQCINTFFKNLITHIHIIAESDGPIL